VAEAALVVAAEVALPTVAEAVVVEALTTNPIRITTA